MNKEVCSIFLEVVGPILGELVINMREYDRVTY